MDGLVEKVARSYALIENNDGFDEPWECYSAHARAAIEAVFEWAENQSAVMFHDDGRKLFDLATLRKQALG